MEKIKRFFKEEDGLELSEYALMGALVCAAVAGVITLLGTTIQAALQSIVDAF
jgi:Flp pilus assembly pilin Flp